MSKRGANGDNTIIPDATKHNYSVVLNGITWTALATKPGTNPNSDPIPTTDNGGIGKITDATTQVTITGTVAPTGQALKYKHTNNGDTADVNFTGDTNSQALPSNIKTIKIVLKKGTVPGGRLA